jgi:cell division protein FtsW
MLNFPATGPSYSQKILSLVFLIAVIGLVALASASMPFSFREMGGNEWAFFKKQLIFWGIALLVFGLVVRVELRYWQEYRWAVFFLGLLLLVLVLIPGIGKEVKGATRWINLGVMSFQSSEFMKLAMIVFIAAFIKKFEKDINEDDWAIWRILGVPLLLVGILLYFEPDLGSIFVISMIVMGMMFIAGAPWKGFLLMLLTVAIMIAALIYFEPYRWERVTAYLDPWKDALGSGYQLTQALMAFGRGEIFGVGLGNSVLKLYYLPDAHTDFVLSIFAEEMGFVGLAILLILYLALFIQMIGLGRYAAEKGQAFASALVYGVALWILIQVAVNVSMNMGMIPTKGLTLPFVSYGGSSLLMLMIGLALVIRVDKELREKY